MDDLVPRRKLLSFLPEFMQKFKEMKNIMASEDVELENVDTSIQFLYDNAYIMDCSEHGIKKYESFLGIVPGKEDTLEMRKARVLSRWNQMIPYTFSTLIQKLDSLCGEGNYTVTRDEKNYYLKFDFKNLGFYGQVEEVLSLLSDVLPMNIFYDYEVVLNICAESKLSLYTGMASVELIEIY